MVVGVVFEELKETIGGGFTFQNTLLDGIRATSDGSKHQFRFYSVGGKVREPWLTVIRRNAWTRIWQRTLLAVRGACDRAGVRRPSIRTELERAFLRDGVEIVWFATPYAQPCDLPYIFTLYDLEHLRQPWYPEVGAEGRWEQRQRYYERYIPRATRIIIPGKVGAEQLQALFNVTPDRILALPHPTPHVAANDQASNLDAAGDLSRLGVASPYVLYPAQLWAHKNHVVLFEALELLPEYHLVCVGSDKGIRKHLQVLASEIGVADRAHFLGFVSQADLVLLYRNAHALTYPSHFGPENLPPLEAFSLGCPVVASDIPGAQEEMGDAALLVAPNDAAGFAHAVHALEDAELRKTFISRGRTRAGERRVEDYVAAVIDFLDEFAPIRRSWSAARVAR